MHQKRTIPILLAAALAWSGAAAAEEVTVSLGSAIQYDSNPGRDSGGSGSNSGAFGSRVHTEITLDGDSEGRFDYSLRYRPTYVYFPSASQPGRWTHDLSGNFNFQLAARTVLSGTERLRISDVFDFSQDDPVLDENGQPIDDTQPINSGRELALRSNTALNLRHQLSERLTWTTTASQSLYQTKASSRVNSQTFGGQTALNYRYDGATNFGGGGSITLQQFDSASSSGVSQSTTNTYIYRGFANLTRRFGETVTLTIQGGPALIQTTQNQPNQNAKMIPTIPYYKVPAATPGSSEPAYRVALQLSEPIPGTLSVLPVEFVLPPDSLILGDLRECVSYGGEDLVTGSGCHVQSNSFDLKGQLFLANDDSYEDELAAQLLEQQNEEIANPKIQDPVQRALFLAYEIPAGYTTAGHVAAINSILENTTDLMFDPANEPDPPSGTRLTLFGSAQLTKRWSENVVTSIAYTRSQSNASGLSTSTIEDQVTFSGTWKPSQRWNFRAGAWWVQRQSISSVLRTYQIAGAVPEDDTNVPASLFLVPDAELSSRTGFLLPVTIDNPVDTTRWGFQLKAERKLTRHLIGNMRFTFNNQNSRNDFGSSTTITDWVAVVGLNYTFQPVSFW